MLQDGYLVLKDSEGSPKYSLCASLIEKMAVNGTQVLDISEQDGKFFPNNKYDVKSSLMFPYPRKEGLVVRRWHSKQFDRSGLIIETLKKNSHGIYNSSSFYFETDRLLSDNEIEGMNYETVTDILEGD